MATSSSSSSDTLSYKQESMNINQPLPSTSSSSISIPYTNMFRMRSISINEHTMDNDPDGSLSPPSSSTSSQCSSYSSINSATTMITNINLCGLNFTVNKQDLNKLWNFYNGQQQHNFIPKMKCAKTIRYRNQHYPQYNANQHEKSLRNAANCGNVDMIKQLLQQSQHINVNASDERKRTALHFASVRGYNDIAWLLLINGADPNTRDVVGNTPLHLAVCASRLDMVILLLKNGAICTSYDNNGRTPINLAHSKLLYLSKSLEKRRIILSSSSEQSSSTGESLEKLKLEIMKISIMLQIYFEKCKSDAEKCINMDIIKNRVEQSQTSQEIENDVNDLLKCLQDWSL
nr:ankyrin repeat domain-containing protein 54-like isoform X2 [Dermatophagoides farinae]